MGGEVRLGDVPLSLGKLRLGGMLLGETRLTGKLLGEVRVTEKLLGEVRLGNIVSSCPMLGETFSSRGRK